MTDYKPPKEGPYEEFYENGQLERRGTWTRAGRDGLFEQFFPNGQIKYRGMYINGSAEGTHEDYMKEDSLERIDCNYKDNMFKGLYEQFYEMANWREEEIILRTKKLENGNILMKMEKKLQR